MDSRSVDVKMNDTSSLSRAVPSKADVTLGIHYNKTRGVWLSVLVETYEKTTSSLIVSAKGTWIHARVYEKCIGNSTVG